MNFKIIIIATRLLHLIYKTLSIPSIQCMHAHTQKPLDFIDIRQVWLRLVKFCALLIDLKLLVFIFSLRVGFVSQSTLILGEFFLLSLCKKKNLSIWVREWERGTDMCVLKVEMHIRCPMHSHTLSKSDRCWTHIFISMTVDSLKCEQ